MKSVSDTSTSRQTVLAYWKTPLTRSRCFLIRRFSVKKAHSSITYHTLNKHSSNGSYENNVARIERKADFRSTETKCAVTVFPGAGL
jgi:hypothetical protein